MVDGRWTLTPKVLGYLVIWGLGLSPAILGAWAPLSMALFFFLLPLITRWVGVGGYAELGLQLHQGWGWNLGIGFVTGSLLPLGLFLALWAMGLLQPVGLIAWPGVLLQGLVIGLQTLYIGFWEELLCRGYLLRALPARLSPVVTLLVVGLLFSLFHIPRWGAPPAWWAFWFLSGIMLALPVLATGSLWFSAGLHWGLDLLWFALLLNDGLIRFGPLGNSAQNSGVAALVGVLFFLPLVWWVGERMAKTAG